MADRRAIRGRICHADDGVKRRHHLVAECVPKTSDDRQFATATLRNRDFIPDVLHDVLTMTGAVVEIASGSGEHFVHFARNFPTLAFQASDPEPDALLSVAAWVKAAGVENVRAPFALDASHSVWPIASARRHHLYQHGPYLALD
jgi:tRNA G46 methylase TrmB